MWELLKKGPSATFVPRVTASEDEETRAPRIRCPRCRWEPTPDTVWTCVSEGTPEPFFGGCGTAWHTFATHGKCPGCAHQWQWTSCPRCEAWSLHVDWYDGGPRT